MAYVLIDEAGVVVQRQPNAEEGFVEAPDDVCCGMVLQGVEFVQPASSAPLVPVEVSMAQARLALRRAGLLDAVQAAIEALPEPDRTDVQIEWDHRSVVRRDYSLVAQLAPALGLDGEALDALFIQAAEL